MVRQVIDSMMRVVSSSGSDRRLSACKAGRAPLLSGRKWLSSRCYHDLIMRWTSSLFVTGHDHHEMHPPPPPHTHTWQAVTYWPSELRAVLSSHWILWRAVALSSEPHEDKIRKTWHRSLTGHMLKHGVSRSHGVKCCGAIFRAF